MVNNNNTSNNKKKKWENKKNDKLGFQWKKAGKTSFVWIAIILMTMYISSILSENKRTEIEINYTEYKNYLEEGLIEKAVIIDKTFHGEFKSPQVIDTPLGQKIDVEKELKKFIENEKNRQLNNFSIIFYKRLEKNTEINEY